MIATPNTPQKILIVRLGALGDIIHTLPILAMLRQAFPKADIDWVVGPAGRELIDGHPMLNRIHTFPGLKWRCLFEAFGVLATLRKSHYDWVIDTQGLFKTGLISLVSGSPVRAGLANSREGAALAYTHRAKTGPLRAADKPVTQHYTELLGSLGVTSAPQAPKDTLLPPHSKAVLDALNAKLGSLGIASNAPCVALAPKTTWNSKDWPESYWIELLHALEKTPAQILLLGSLDDKPFLKRLQAEGNPSNVFIPDFTLSELAAFYAQQRPIVVGGDSLPLHLASAVPHVPTLGLYGATSAIRTGPLNNGGVQKLLFVSPKLPCQPCHQRVCHEAQHSCMLKLSPMTVFNEIQALLGFKTQIN